MIVLIIGCMGSGKSVVELECEKQGLHRVISTTTRERRNGESEDAYHFVSKSEFEKLIKEDKMVEYTIFRENYYGIAKADLTENCVAVVEPNGLQSIKKLYKDKVFTVFLEVTETEGVLRAKKRGDCLKEISKRIIEDRQLYTPELLEEIDLIVTNIKLEAIPNLVTKEILGIKKHD